MPHPETLADLVRALRERALLTQDDLAHRSGLSVGTVRGLEAGRIRRPRSGSVRLLADALALSEPDRAALVALARGDQVVRAGNIRQRPGVVPAQLPAAVAGFTGRTDALKLLDETLPAAASAAAIAVITGTAGIGKTALAVHWAHQVRERFPDGQLYLNLRGFDPSRSPISPAEAIRGLLDALHVPAQRIPAALDAQAGLYRTLLADRRTLVVLDNARDAEQVRPLLPGAPGCLALVTSRDRLSSLIALEGARPLTLDLLSDSEARDLLARRLGADRVAAHPRAVDELVTGCARLPLALAIVAARAAGHPDASLAALADQLGEARHRLDAVTGDDTATDVRAVFSWSYDALGSPAARLFRLLGLHPGPDTTEAAAVSLAASPPERVHPLLAELARAHLIVEHAPGRYTFHDLLRAYAAELAHTMDPPAERHAATHRILDHYLHTAHAAALSLMPSRQPLALSAPHPGTTVEDLTGHDRAAAWFTTEHAVLLAAIDHAANTGHDAHATHLAWTLQDHLDRRGYWPDLAATQHIALQAAVRAGDLTGQAHAHRGIARADFTRGQHSDAHTHLRHALDRYRELGDLIGEADTNRNLSLVLWHLDRRYEALHHAQQALALYAESGHRAGRARALNAVGWCHARLGDYARALTYCEQGLSLQQQIGDQFGQAHAWHGVAHAHHHLEHHDQAITSYERANNLFRKLGDRYDEAICKTGIGDIHHAAGRPDAARNAWQSALSILTELDHPDADHVRTKLA